MNLKIRSLQKLMYELQKWPGIGPKSAAKLVCHIIKKKEQDIPPLVSALNEAASNVANCKQCFGWSENSPICSICKDASRNSTLLCVVENPFDIFRIEDSGVFKGFYHVLHGMISPLHNRAPEDLTIEALVKKIEKSSAEKGPIKEVLLALDTHLEGDTTSLYLLKKLKPLQVKISRLAEGIPLGSHLDFVDERTLSRAIVNRTEMEV